MRKSIPTVGSALASSATSMLRLKVINEILYYLRRLLKMARRLQSLNIREGVESESDSQIFEEFEQLKKEIDEFEASI